MKSTIQALILLAISLLQPAPIQTAKQPKVQPGPGEPNWVDLLKDRYHLDMFKDLENPVETTAEEASGLFRKAGDGPVKFTPIVALGLETNTRGGWYEPGKENSDVRQKLWSYKFKNTTEDLAKEKNLPPPLLDGSKVEFEPGKSTFGLWISNDGFDDGGVYTEPKLVKAHNKRLAAQPYKTMIYPYKDKSGKKLPHTYLIGWEYSTNDDFQDVICLVENVDLVKE